MKVHKFIFLWFRISIFYFSPSPYWTKTKSPIKKFSVIVERIQNITRLFLFLDVYIYIKFHPSLTIHWLLQSWTVQGLYSTVCIVYLHTIFQTIWSFVRTKLTGLDIWVPYFKEETHVNRRHSFAFLSDNLHHDAHHWFFFLNTVNG